MKVQSYTQTGKKEKEITVADSVFGLSWNGDLVHHVITSLRSNLRVGTAHSKDRSEVSGGGRKPWKQKGTGRARHGSTRSPIWVGGGVTHGPRTEKVYGKKVNVKERIKALCILLSRKMKDNEILFIDGLKLEEVKTKRAKDIINDLSTIKGFEDLSTKKNNAALIVLSERDEDSVRAFSNFGNIELKPMKDISALDVATFKYIVVVNPKESIKVLEERLEKKPRKALVTA